MCACAHSPECAQDPARAGRSVPVVEWCRRFRVLRLPFSSFSRAADGRTRVKMGRLDGCCCCFNLRDGSQAVGITFLVLGSLGLVSQIGSTIWLHQQENFHSTPGVVGQTVLGFGLSILHLVMNALLVHGVNKSHRGMILSWIIYFGIVNGLYSAGVAIAFIVTCVYGVWWLVLLVLAVAALIGVFWYWFVVVLHYYQDLRERNGFVYGKQQSEGHAL